MLAVGWPSSATVGTSGKSATRCCEETENARIEPCFSSGATVPVVSDARSICPPSSGADASAPLRNGTCVTWIPAERTSASATRCDSLPTPGVPKVSLPGLSLACLTMSANVLNGEAVLATSHAGWTETMAIGTKSRRASLPASTARSVSGAVVVKNSVGHRWARWRRRRRRSGRPRRRGSRS